MSSVIGGLFRPPRRRRVILALIIAVLLGGLCWFIGMDWPHAAAIALVVLAAAVAVLTPSEGESAPWLAQTEPPADGIRHDVNRLAWGLRPSRRGVPAAGLRRVRLLAAARLRRHGLDLDDAHDRDEVAALIGPRAMAVLIPPGRAPSLTAVVGCLDALDRIADDHRPTTRRTPAP